MGRITQDNVDGIEFLAPVKIPATADLKISATSNGAGSYCSAYLEVWLE